MADHNNACPCALDHHDRLWAVLQGAAPETGERFFGVQAAKPLPSPWDPLCLGEGEFVQRLRRMKRNQPGKATAPTTARKVSSTIRTLARPTPGHGNQRAPAR